MPTMWICDNCGCELKVEKKPFECPLCLRHDVSFIKTSFDGPSEEDLENKKKYEDIIDKLDAYNEGCDPENFKCSFDE